MDEPAVPAAGSLWLSVVGRASSGEQWIRSGSVDRRRRGSLSYRVFLCRSDRSCLNGGDRGVADVINGIRIVVDRAGEAKRRVMGVNCNALLIRALVPIRT